MTTTIVMIAESIRFVISFLLLRQGSRSGARAAVGTCAEPPLPPPGRIWMFPVRSVPPSGPTQPTGAVVPLKPVRSGEETTQKKIRKMSIPPPESDLSSTYTTTDSSFERHSDPDPPHWPTSTARPPVPFG